ncbi:MAG TPA: tRNA epoxyqueuosine(34) reductase QueG [Pirellulales bacterium]|jgi:epoxyqueuosine reductase|nr:tRNA epoxyqueuosine(34) reductase QueG [Pirellulales bacterium]
MTPAELTTALRNEAQRLGFGLSGACAAVPPPGSVDRLRAWLSAGYAGQMHYLADRADAYADPARVLDGARSALMLAMDYRTSPPTCPDRGQGRISRYAWGGDYHDVIHERLHRLADFLRQLVPGARVRGVVDTAPLLEREFAQAAGLGWVGKNTLLLNQRHGSWFFLAALLTDQALEYAGEAETDHCGTCRACLDACPTQAFVAPWVLDSRKCISYLTIELREPVDRALRPAMGDWLFGCDVCQDVCPWNRRAPTSEEPAFEPHARHDPVELAELFALDEAGFRARFRHTPLWRAHRRGLLRNAAIVLGNQRDPEAIEALVTGLADADALVRGACAWALGQYGLPPARAAVECRQCIETDPQVLAEISAALAPRAPTARNAGKREALGDAGTLAL